MVPPPTVSASRFLSCPFFFFFLALFVSGVLPPSVLLSSYESPPAVVYFFFPSPLFSGFQDFFFTPVIPLGR